MFLLLRISLNTAQLAITLGSLGSDRFRVQYLPSLGALRAVCRGPRVLFRCVTRYCFLKIKKQAADPSSLGCSFELEDASSSPANVPFCSFFRLPCFPPILSSVVFFSQVLYDTYARSLYVQQYTRYVRSSLELHGSPQLCLPCRGTGLRCIYCPRLGACAVCHTRMCRVYCIMFIFLETMQSAWSK